MRNLLTLLALAPLCAVAQSVPTHEMYVDFGYQGLQTMVSVLPNWTPGAAASDDPAYVDDNFFISRVPMKPRFFRATQQANPSLDDSNAKNLCWWVPCGELTKKWGPLPRWNFDGDNFNLWQYINIHGNWSNSWWRVPGAFNDAAHRNGVRTGCLLFIDWGSTINTSQGNIGYYINQLCRKSAGKYMYAEKMVDYLRYYGIDGIGVNPEGSWQASLASNFQGFLAECHRVAEAKGWPFHVEWYAFTSNIGALTDNGCQLTTNNDKWFQDTSDGTPVTDVYFLNYNWSESGLATSAQTAVSEGRSSFDVYAGFDQQGRGYGKNGNAGWSALMRQPVSVVVWGAHDRSQLYTSSTEGGTSDKAIQSEYQTKQEMLFSGGTRNVLSRPAVTDDNISGSLYDLQRWHGYATAVREQSTLSELPFVTRFNLGNGAMFNDCGVTTNAHKWYNLGLQDLLPTWRWWIDRGDGKTPPADAINMDFTFDDAWFGGSCLKAHGATSRSDVRLFETKWSVSSSDDRFSLTFKPATTGGDVSLMVSLEGSENDYAYVPLISGGVLAGSGAGVAAGEWNTLSLSAADLGLSAGSVIAGVGLSFTNTPADYSCLLGELSYVPGGFSETPVQPVITYSEVLKRYYNRADFKVVFDLPFSGSRPAEYDGRPIYNEEVGAWYYEIFISQGGKETLLGATTSWASYVVEAPLDPAYDTFAIGVRTVGRDGQTKSPITWTAQLESPLSVIDDITLNKEVIKPGEDFTIGFEDPNHQRADIRILDDLTGAEMASQRDVLTLTTSLPSTGSYDVEVTQADGSVDMHRDIILVTPEETGRLPHIESLSLTSGGQSTDIVSGGAQIADAQPTVTAGESVTAEASLLPGDSYNGQPCSVSRSLYMASPYQFTVGGQVLLNAYRQNSYALWFKVQEFSHQSLGTLLMTQVNRNYGGTWTESVWGEMWTAIRPAGYAKNNNIGRDNADNELSVSLDGPPAGTANYEHNNDVDGLTDGYSLKPNTWYHCCVVKDNGFVKMYLNGKLVINTYVRGAQPKAWTSTVGGVTYYPNFYVGGSMTNLASFTGWVDEVQLWSKALSEDEVREAMQGYSPDNVPADLQGYFTFEETTTDSEGMVCFPNLGHCADVPLGYMTTSSVSGNVTTDVHQNSLTTALGVPAITGSFPIIYDSSIWAFQGGSAVSSSSADHSQSSAAGSFSWSPAGEGAVTFTATNSWGSSSVSFPVSVSEADGIHAVTTDTPAGAQPTATYDLQGRRVTGSRAHGLYIEGGRKVIK